MRDPVLFRSMGQTGLHINSPKDTQAGPLADYYVFIVRCCEENAISALVITVALSWLQIFIPLNFYSTFW